MYARNLCIAPLEWTRPTHVVVPSRILSGETRQRLRATCNVNIASSQEQVQWGISYWRKQDSIQESKTAFKFTKTGFWLNVLFVGHFGNNGTGLSDWRERREDNDTTIWRYVSNFHRPDLLKEAPARHGSYSWSGDTHITIYGFTMYQIATTRKFTIYQ